MTLLHTNLIHLTVLRLRRLVTRLSPWRPVLAPGRVHGRFVVDKVTLGQTFSEFFGFPCQYYSTVFPYIYHLGDEKQARRWPQFRDITLPPRHEQLIPRNQALDKVTVAWLV
jgi:hypothetical protein